jgi:SsrA-binding protein
MDEASYKNVAQNRKARHEYEILDTYEVGIVLAGTEVKSLRAAKVQFVDSYAIIENGELWVHNIHITPYDHGNVHNHEPVRKRKLLMHKQELRKLYARSVERGLTLIPLRIYFKNKVAKLEIGLARGKKLHDKRSSVADRDARREIDRKMKEHGR